MRRAVLLAAFLTAGCAGARKEGGGKADAGRPVVERHEPRRGETLATAELGGNGKPGVWRYTRRGADGKPFLARQEKDLDGDGRTDLWEEFGEDGQVRQQTFDLDLDGKPDAILFFERGSLVRKEFAIGLDGRPRAWAFYEDGQLVRRERDLDGDGKIDHREDVESRRAVGLTSGPDAATRPDGLAGDRPAPAQK